MSLRRLALYFTACLATAMLLAICWLAVFVPVDKSAQPIVPPRIELLTRDGQPFAQMGPQMGKPVRVDLLPEHVAQAFYAIEDRRFRSHWGIDPIGFGRSLINNFTGGNRQGGSTITQQLAKNVYLLDPETGRPAPGYFRKVKEAFIALWLEAWLTKDQILERYLSNVAFGQNIYGLRAASNRYFSREPERLTLAQAVMLAGLVQAPSRYDPTRHAARAQRRARLVATAMASANYISADEAAALGAADLDIRDLPLAGTGTYFADWVVEAAREESGTGHAERRVLTTLDGSLQAFARQVVADVPAGLQTALVAMRPNGEVVAMIGGRDYARSKFNLAVSARRQPGSTFKLFTYLAALQNGMTASDSISDAAFETGAYRPKNASGQYGGAITLQEAFAASSNVAAVRLFQRVGAEKVIATAQSLGITETLRAEPSLALGTSEVSLLHMTAAYAAIAAGTYPVRPVGLPVRPRGWFDRWFDRPAMLKAEPLGEMRAMLGQVVRAGTGRAAALRVPAYGKTGTSQNNRDAWFIGYAGDLVVGVWIGDDDAKTAGISGGTMPALVWQRFMTDALGAGKLTLAPRPDIAAREGGDARPAPVRTDDRDEKGGTGGAGERGAADRPATGRGVFTGDDGGPFAAPLPPRAKPSIDLGKASASGFGVESARSGSGPVAIGGNEPSRTVRVRPTPSPATSRAATARRPAEVRLKDGSVAEFELRD